MTYWWEMDLEEWGMCLEEGLFLFWCCTSLFFHLPETPAVEKRTSTAEGVRFDLSIHYVFILISGWIWTLWWNREYFKRGTEKNNMGIIFKKCCRKPRCTSLLLMQNLLTACFYIWWVQEILLHLTTKLELTWRIVMVSFCVFYTGQSRFPPALTTNQNQSFLYVHRGHLILIVCVRQVCRQLLRRQN